MKGKSSKKKQPRGLPAGGILDDDPYEPLVRVGMEILEPETSIFLDNWCVGDSAPGCAVLVWGHG